MRRLALVFAVANAAQDAASSSLAPKEVDVGNTGDVEAELASKLNGCEHVFIDAGANIGMHARFLFEPQTYTDSSFKNVFEENFGDPARRNTTCAIEFEPNPSHEPRLRKLAAAYEKVGWRVVVAPYGVSDRRETLKFYSDAESKFEDWGFGTKPNSKTKDNSLDVATVDFPRFLKLLSARSPPAGRDLGKTVIKMDIESAEFGVLPPMIMRGSLCNDVDYISVEFHARYTPISYEGRELSKLNSKADADSLVETLRSMVRDSSDSCRTKELALDDDETYVHDINEEQRSDPTPPQPLLS